MSSNDCFEPDFWTITGAHTAARPPAATRPAHAMRPVQPTLLGQPKRRMRPMQPTLVGQPLGGRPTSLWRMVAWMEAELFGAR